jgi:hypothetical protein
MDRGDRDIVVIGRLRSIPVLAWAVVMAGMAVFFLWREIRGGGFAGTLYYHVLGPLLGPIAIGASVYAAYLCHRMWREREAYLCHDGVRLYQGRDGSWPLAAIRDVMLTSNWLGIRSLRIAVDDGGGRVSRPELAKVYMLAGTPEAMRAAVARVVAEARTEPG